MASDNEHQLKRQVEERLGRAISPAAWALTRERRYVEDALREHTLEEICDFVAGLLQVEEAAVRAAAPSAPPSRGRVPSNVRDHLGPRIEALSRLAAEHAAGDEEILRFRERVLGLTSPMSAAEAEAYLERPEARRSGFPGRQELLLLQYQNRRVFHDIHVEPGSPLDGLRKLAGRLAESYPWEPQQAAAFVLEGLVPIATPFVLRLPQPIHADRPRRVRVTMDIDLWMPASAVLQSYRDLQRRVLPGHNRPVSRSSIDVVSFVLRNRPAPWRELVSCWNTEHQKSAFSDYRHLRTAFKRAERSLLQPSYRLYFGPDSESRPKVRQAARARSQRPIATATSGQTRSASPSRRLK